jgi:oligogalacturonide lyase
MPVRLCWLSPVIPVIVATVSAAEVPREWVDASTGHRVLRLSDDSGGSSLYFHQNGYTATGDKMVFTTNQGLSIVELKTRTVEPLVTGRVGQVVVGRKTRQVFYRKEGAVWATNLDTRRSEVIAKVPQLASGSGLAVNADETLLGGSFVEDVPNPQAPPEALIRMDALRTPEAIESSLEARWARRRPMALYTIKIATGEFQTFHHSSDWLNHVQFSPSDPSLLMFCHEGPWHKVDRIWTIRTDGTGVRLMHARTMEMEIAGHEFWSPDGKTIWYDLQTPRGEQFWLAGVDLATGERRRFSLERDRWSVHFNVSPDGRLFAGDGGGPQMVAKAKDGQWIYLFRPENGALRWEPLVNMAAHDYRLEPNVSFTPDGEWIVFRSNMHGATHVYAVEVRKAKR